MTRSSNKKHWRSQVEWNSVNLCLLETEGGILDCTRWFFLIRNRDFFLSQELFHSKDGLGEVIFGFTEDHFLSPRMNVTQPNSN